MVDSNKCEICDKGYKSNKYLAQHFNFVHKLEKEHKCDICQKVFKLYRLLTSHQKIVHENKKHHKCDSCGREFSDAGNLKRHIYAIEIVNNFEQEA